MQSASNSSQFTCCNLQFPSWPPEAAFRKRDQFVEEKCAHSVLMDARQVSGPFPASGIAGISP